MIRVAQIVRPATGGMRRHVGSLVSHLDRSEFAPTLFAPPDFHLDSTVEGIPHESVAIASKTSPFRDLRAIVALGRRLRGAFDLVHSHGLRGALIGVPAARLARIPALFTAHNLVPLSGQLTRRVLRFLARNAPVIAVSRAVAATLEAHGISSVRIQVVPNGIDLALFDNPAPDEAGRRQILGELIATPGVYVQNCVSAAWLRDPRHLGERVFVIAGIGRLSREKGFDVLISALALPQALHPATTGLAQPLLILAGSGPDEARLRSLAQGVPNICMVGALADVAPLLSAADVVAVPSREEGQGIVALEAMAAHKPVVAARVGGLVETIVEGETGVMVPPDDPKALAAALGELQRSPDLCIRMGNRGRERAEQHYTLDGMMDRLTAIYRLAAV